MTPPKIRIIPTMLYNGVELVKGKGFDSWRQVGSVMQAVKVYNMREVDELIFLDIAATRQGRSPDFALIDDMADECFMPLTVGGGIRTIDDVRKLLQVGADKVALNSAIYHTPELITQIAEKFGTQCVVVSIDARPMADGYECLSHSGTKSTGRNPVEVAKEAQERGAGEILITSVPRDGLMEGYDVTLTKLVSDAVSIPVIASGGAGSAEDVAEVLLGSSASAAAAASIFHFTQLTPREVKLGLRDRGFSVRL